MKVTFAYILFFLLLCSINAKSNDILGLETTLVTNLECKSDTTIQLSSIPSQINVLDLLDNTNASCTYSYKRDAIITEKNIDCSFLKGFPDRTEVVWVYEIPNNGTFALDSCLVDLTIVNNGVCSCDHPDYGGLMDVYYTANGPDWSDKSGWDQGALGLDCAVCDWFGVICEGDRVTRVNLVNNELSGQLANPNLSELIQLSVGNNDLNGNIPNFTLLPKLELLYADFNQITGGIPLFNNCPNIRQIDISDNRLSGGIPELPGSANLETFDVAINGLSGCFPSFTCNPGLNFSSGDNFLMPWEGHESQYCANPSNEIGAPCSINGNGGEISSSCLCDIFLTPASIEILAWHDSQNDGIYDNGDKCTEVGMQDIPSFTLLLNGFPAKQIDGVTPVTFSFIGNGVWRAENLLPANGYSIRTSVPSPWRIAKAHYDGSIADVGDKDNRDSDFNVDFRLSPSFDLSQGQTKTNIDLGLYQNLTLGGVVWVQYDNANGTYDGPPDEALVSDIIMNLYKDNDGDGIFESLISTTVTDTEGEYIFSDIAPDTYMVEVDRDNFDAGTQLEVFQCVTDNFLLDGSPLSNDGIGPNGTTNGGAEASPVLLRSGCEPSGNENITVDFGFFTGFDCQASNPDYFAIDCSETDPDSPNYNNFFPFCDLNFLDGFCSTMTPIITGNGPTPLCDNGGIPHNISWFSFVAGHGDYTVEVTPGRCTDSLGNIPGLGIQMGVYNDCSFTEQIGPCVGTPSSQAPVSFSNLDPNTGQLVLIPGNTYYVFLDGAQGSVCKYDVEVIGNFVPYLPGCPSGIDCDGDNVDSDCTVAVCPGEEILFTLQDIVIEGIDYMWSVSQPNGWEIISTIPDPANPLETNFNNIEIRFNEDGVYTVCYESITSKCFSNSRTNDCGSDPALCKEITVFSFADEDFGTKYLCQWELDAYVGPTEDDNGNPDPNGDGLEGWQTNLNFWSEGVYEYEVVRADGCVYMERVEIIKKVDPDPAIADTIFCGNDPVDVYGFFIDENIVLDQFNLAPDVFAANGCDSIVDLYIWFMYLEGELTNSGNGNPNYTIEFAENTAATRDADARTVYTYNWYRTAFGVGDGFEFNDGDPDNNPYTFETSECGEYQLHINMTVNDQTSGLPLKGCTYIFTTNIECPTCEASSDICEETSDIVLETDLDGVVAYECISGCIENASPETNVDDCSLDTNPTVWHTFEVDADARQVFVNVSSDDGSWSPSFTIFDGACNNLNQISDCNSGDVLSVAISTGTSKVYVAVSVEDPANVVDPSYTICASAIFCESVPASIELSETSLELCNNSDFTIDVDISDDSSTDILVESMLNPNVLGVSMMQTLSGGAGTLVQNLSLNTGINTAQEVIYNFSVAGGQGCSGVLGNQLTVTVYPDIEVEFAFDLEVCPDSCIVLSPIVSGGTGDYASFEWSTGSVDTSIEVCPSTSSSYTLTVVDDLGCSSITDVNVALNPNVVFTSSNDSLTICQELNGQNENGELIISNFGGTPPYTIVWTPPNGLVGGIASTMISIPGDTYFIDEEASSTSSAPYPLLVQVVDAMGCIARDTILVSILEKTQCDPTSTIDEDFDIKVFPNPTKDWITIHSDQVIKGPIAIYDIYGHQLIETRDIEINVSELPSGIYFLKVDNTVVKFYKL